MASKMFRTESGVAQIAEFGAALYLLIIFLVFFLFSTISFIFSLTVAEAAIVCGASKSANAAAYDTALERGIEGITEVSQSGIGKLANLLPVGGYENSGVNLLIDVTDGKSQKVQSVGPDAPLSTPANPDKYCYSYRLTYTFSLGPLIKGCPAKLSGITYVTQPVRLVFSAERAVEHVDGLHILLSKAKQLE